jgi:hypothetical protein
LAEYLPPETTAQSALHATAYSLRCNALIVNALQKAVFHYAKDGLSGGNPRPFARRKAVD